jgi:hypothetical protein
MNKGYMLSSEEGLTDEGAFKLDDVKRPLNPLVSCPICGEPNADEWYVIVGGRIEAGGCQDCWEAQCDQQWWQAVDELADLPGS